MTDIEDPGAEQLVVEHLRAVLQSPATLDELAGEKRARRAFALAQYDLGPATAAATSGTRRFVTGIAIAIAAVLATGGLAAARALPQPIQRLAADALGAIGIDVPASIDEPPVHRPPAARPPTSTPGPVVAEAPTASTPPLEPPTPPEPASPPVVKPVAAPPTPPTPVVPSAPEPPTPPTIDTNPPPPPPPPVSSPSDKGVGNGGVPGQGGANPNASENNRGGNSTKK